MKNTILITVLVGALAGASSSLLTRALSSPPGAEASTPGGSLGLAPGGTSDSAELGEQLATLQRRNGELEMRLAALEASGASSSREAMGTQSGEDVAKLQQDIADLAAALNDPKSAQSMGLRKSVRSAMEQIKEEDDAVRQQQREDRDLARIDERLTDLQDKLGLDQVQKRSMREVLLAENTKRSEMFSAMRNGGMDRTEIRSSMEELRTETKTSLGNILSPMQLEDYEKIESESRWGGGNRGGGGGRGGRGGGGQSD